VALRASLGTSRTDGSSGLSDFAFRASGRRLAAWRALSEVLEQVHLGEFIERDMAAVRVSNEQRAATVGARSYFASHPRPKSPRDLTSHRCFNFRHGSSGVYQWEFEKGRKSLAVAVNGPLTVDDVEVTSSTSEGRS
jgi:hypothetical protein